MTNADRSGTVLIMHTTETQPLRIRKLTISLTDAEHAEYVRISNERHNRTPGKQGQSVIRSWIAAEQAAEADEAAQPEAA